MQYFYHHGRKYRSPKKRKPIWTSAVDGLIIAVGMATMSFFIPYLLLV